MLRQMLMLGLVACLLGQTACSSLESRSPVSQKSVMDQPSSAYSFNDELASGGEGPAMVVIPKGRFMMGDQQGVGNDNESMYEAKINQSYAIGQFEVTVSDFRKFVDATAYVTNAEKAKGCYTFDSTNNWGWVEGKSWIQPSFYQSDNHPVVCVSWHDAVAYTQWLSTQTGQQYRLPTEAEWEYVARAGTTTNYWWGNDNGKCKNANCCLSQNWMDKQTVAVGSYAANGFGVFDTSGNVWEWTSSNYVEQYNGEPSDHVVDLAEDDTVKSLRGGSWYNFPSDTRPSRRWKNDSQQRYSTIGFRVARVVTPKFVNAALGKINH